MTLGALEGLDYAAYVHIAGADYDSLIGRISFKWHWLDTKRVQLDVAIPPNATALVHLPADRKITHDPEAIKLANSGGDAILQIDSGRYSFTIGKFD